MRKLCLPIFIVLAAGCTSSAPSYFTLDMTPTGEARPSVNITVGHLRVSDAIAGKNIMIQKSPTEIEYYALEQWAAGLADLLREKLQAEFGDVTEGRPSYSLSGDILAFQQVDLPEGGAEAHARLLLGFRPAGASRYADPLLERSYDVRLPAEATPAGVVQALSDCAETIAAEVASDATRLPAEEQ